MRSRVKLIKLHTQGDTSEKSTVAEEIGSDDGTEATEDASLQYTSPSEESDVEYLESTQGKGHHQERVSRSVELDTDLVQRALKTFTLSNPKKNSIDQEQGSVSPSQASRITDSA